MIFVDSCRTQMGGDPYVGPPEDWPQHITAFPPTLELPTQSPKTLFSDVADIANRTKIITISPSYDAFFNPKTHVTVFGNLRHIHYAPLGAVLAHEYRGQFSEKFTGMNYNAHTSHLDGTIAPSETIAITALSIFHRGPSGEKYTLA